VVLHSTLVSSHILHCDLDADIDELLCRGDLLLDWVNYAERYAQLQTHESHQLMHCRVRLDAVD
jgi:hypothetical protein